MMRSRLNSRYLIFALTCMFILLSAPPSEALEVSGYYDFETYGDSSENKPVGGIGPLNYNTTILSGWRDINDNGGTDWWVSSTENELVAHNDYSFPFELGIDFNFYDGRHYLAKAASCFFLSFDLTLYDVAAGITTPGPVATPSASDMIPNATLPNDAIYAAWREGTVYSRTSSAHAPGQGIKVGLYGTEFGLKNTILEHYHCPIRYSSGSDIMTTWVRLYETSNIIEVCFWKNMGAYCVAVNPLSFISGMETGSGASYLSDEPPTDTFYSPTYNSESWHSGCFTAVGPAVPPHHYRYAPVSLAWDDVSVWPEDFSSVTGDLPDWWSISNGDMRDFTWTHHNSFGSNPSECMVAEAFCTEELIATRFFDLSSHTGFPYFQFTHEFSDNGGTNLAQVLLTWTTLESDEHVSQHAW
ncbi:hypothetical protein K8T06_06095, partial [bacterium]|nr:hypothetical protein [bacterium]